LFGSNRQNFEVSKELTYLCLTKIYSNLHISRIMAIFT